MTDSARRRFLTNTAALAATAPLVSNAVFGESPVRKLGVALCGLGSLATNQIAPALLKTRNCRLAGIVTALRLGGTLRDLPRIVTDIASPDPGQTSSGETLH